MGSGLSYHILWDKMTPAQRERMLLHLRDIQPEVVNLSTERTADSADYLRDILELCPETLVFERRVARPDNQGQDEGIWQLPLDVWYGWRVTPYLDLFQHPRVVVVYDNESNQDDLTPYAYQMAAAMDRADVDEVALCVGRFSTGNPKEHQYAQLDPMWRKLAGSRHWWGPNEYGGPNPQASAGHLARFLLGWARCDEIGVARPRTMIGETGVLVVKADGTLDPHKGRKSLGWSEEVTADAVIDHSRMWHFFYGVPACYFAPETDARKDKTWGDLTVGENFYKRVVERLEDVALAPQPPFLNNEGEEPMPPEPEPDYGVWEVLPAELQHMGTAVTLAVRERPDRGSTRLGVITYGEAIAVGGVVRGVPLSDLGDQWVWVHVPGQGITGYIHKHYLALPDDEDPPEPTPEEIKNLLKGRMLAEVETMQAGMLAMFDLLREQVERL